MYYNAPLLTDNIDITNIHTIILLNEDVEYQEYLFDNQGDSLINIKIKYDINHKIEKILKLSSNSSIIITQTNITSIEVYTDLGISKLFYCFQGFLRSLK